MSNVVHILGVTLEKICPDHLTNIDTNSKKNVIISVGVSAITRTLIFRDARFGLFFCPPPKNDHHQNHDNDPRPQPVPKHTS